MMSTDGQEYINLHERPPNINGFIKHYEHSTPHHTHYKLAQCSLTQDTKVCYCNTAAFV